MLGAEVRGVLDGDLLGLGAAAFTSASEPLHAETNSNALTRMRERAPARVRGTGRTYWQSRAVVPYFPPVGEVLRDYADVTETRLAAVLRATAIEMQASFEKTGRIPHAGSKGATREERLLLFLQERLPRAASAVGSAEVVAADGTSAGQCDVLIVNPEMPPFFSDGRHSVYPSEAVHGVFEVKSSLNKTELRSALDKISVVKSLPRVHFHPDPYNRHFERHGERLDHMPLSGFVFAYTASTKLETLTSNLIDWCDSHPRGVWPDGVFVLDRGSVVWMSPNRRGLRGGVSRDGQLCMMETGHARDVLLLLAMHMHELYALAYLPPFQLGPYLGYSSFGVARFPTDGWPAAE
jgi:hypothetical protein